VQTLNFSPVYTLATDLMSFDRADTNRWFAEMFGPEDEWTDCGGQTIDPPCGGCQTCLVAQADYAYPAFDHFVKLAAIWLIYCVR
jgi:hypothetical protein